MKQFNEYIETERLEQINEALITFGGQAYPKFGNVIIMAGGAGSGKGFVKSNLIGAEGYTFDVDELKSLAIRTPAIVKKVKDDLGLDLRDIGSDLNNPDNVSKLHDIIGDYLRIPDRRTASLYRSIMLADKNRKPNLIFDVTLKDMRKLQNISRNVVDIGYDKSNIHIVWVVNDIEVAKRQNLSRSRSVPVEILINTHRGAAQTMGDILNMGKNLAKYMDGDIVFAFNKVGVDVELDRSGKGGQYVTDANYFYVKRKGKSPTSIKDLSSDLKRKISSYVPKNVEW